MNGDRNVTVYQLRDELFELRRTALPVLDRKMESARRLGDTSIDFKNETYGLQGVDWSLERHKKYIDKISDELVSNFFVRRSAECNGYVPRIDADFEDLRSGIALLKYEIGCLNWKFSVFEKKVGKSKIVSSFHVGECSG